MAKVNIYKAFFEDKILPIMKGGQKEHNKLIFYLKLYTHLISALDELEYKRGFDRLKIVANLTTTESYPGEAHYIRYINAIVRDVFYNRKRIQRIQSKDPAGDPLHAKTRLLLAQNICMIRILKLSKL